MKWPIVSFTAVGNVPDVPAFMTAEEETSAGRASALPALLSATCLPRRCARFLRGVAPMIPPMRMFSIGKRPDLSQEMRRGGSAAGAGLKRTDYFLMNVNRQRGQPAGASVP